jgi:hypothetical protein
VADSVLKPALCERVSCAVRIKYCERTCGAATGVNLLSLHLNAPAVAAPSLHYDFITTGLCPTPVSWSYECAHAQLVQVAAVQLLGLTSVCLLAHCSTSQPVVFFLLNPAEYPSGTACICATYASYMREATGEGCFLHNVH